VKIKYLVALSIFPLLLASCGLDLDLDLNLDGDDAEQTKKFWAINSVKGELYSVEAALKAEGRYSKIWVERGLMVDKASVSNLALEYDNNMRPILLDTFSVEGPVRDPETGEIVGDNSLDWADYLTDGDEKLSILVLNIPADVAQNYVVAGYFWPINFYSKTDPRDPILQFSNESDIVYMNINIGLGSDLFRTTLAHETQHLINFVNGALLRRFYDRDYDLWDWEGMDLWINEGLSSAAEYVYSKKHNEDQLAWFNNLVVDGKEGTASYYGSLISEGNNFFVWGERPKALLDEYASVYLFFQWLRLQSGGTNKVYREISASVSTDHKAVVNAIKGKGNYSGENNLTWAALLRDWLAANALADPDAKDGTIGASPKHGYMKEPMLSTVAAQFYPKNSQAVSLYPGEGVYSWTDDAGQTYGNITNHGENIRYAGLDYSGDGRVIDGTSYADGMLITYNINTLNSADKDENIKNIEDTQERGEISSDAPPSSLRQRSLRKNMVFNAASYQAKPFKPQPISIWDMISLNKHNEQAKEGF
jgi:hypothetical protein